MTVDKRIFHGVDVKRFQYEEYATNLSYKQINLQDLICKNLFFDKKIDMNCIMINLLKDSKRYDNTIEEFKKVSISNFSHLKATWWRDRSQFCDDLTFVLDFLKDYNSDIVHNQITIDDFGFTNDKNIHIQGGPLACYTSHLRSLIWGYTNFKDYTIICEDDIYIANTELVEEYLQQVPEDWDVVMLNACSKNKLYDGRFYKFDEEFHSCHFYIIRNSSMPIIFSGMYPIVDQVDVLLSNLRYKLNIYNIQETVYQRNISTNTQNNLYVIFNSPHYNQIRENISGIESSILELCDMILVDNHQRNKIIVQDLMYDILWNFVTKSTESKPHPNLETYFVDLESWKDFPAFDKALNNMRFVLQCCKKGIKGDSEALQLMSTFIHTIQNFSLHTDTHKAFGFGSTSHTYKYENTIIKKYCNKLRWITDGHDDTKNIFTKELELLLKLSSFGIGPKLLDYNVEDMTITTEYCGLSLWDKFELPQDWKSQLTDIFSNLDTLGIFYPEFRLQNILILNGKITLVDYGLAIFDQVGNSENLQMFINNLDKINSKIKPDMDRNTYLYLVTQFLDTLQ